MSFGKQYNTKGDEKKAKLIGSSMYMINLKEIQIHDSAFSMLNYQVVLDSGSTVACLPKELFEFVVDQAEKALESKGNVTKHTMSEYKLPCFKTNLTKEDLNEILPSLVFSTSKGLFHEWKPEMYLLISDDTACIGITMQETNEVLMGSTFFHGHNITFDLDKREIRMRETDCSTVNFASIDLNGRNDEGKQKVEDSNNWLRRIMETNYNVVLALIVMLFFVVLFLLYRNWRLKRSMGFMKLQMEGVQ